MSTGEIKLRRKQAQCAMHYRRIRGLAVYTGAGNAGNGNECRSVALWLRKDFTFLVFADAALS